MIERAREARCFTEHLLKRHENGDYATTWVDMMWEGVQWQADQAQQVPELTSCVVNDACWKFIEAMPHNLPAPIHNNLKPALYAAIRHVLTTPDSEDVT